MDGSVVDRLPAGASRLVRAVVMVWRDISVLFRCMMNKQDNCGLERPLGREMQMPVQFLRLLARMVVSLGSSFRMFGGAGTSRISLFCFGSGIL